MCLFWYLYNFEDYISAIIEVVVLIVAGLLFVNVADNVDISKHNHVQQPEEKVEEKPKVEVWRENEWGFVEERYKVNSDGTHYYDNGEWKKIKK